MKVPVLEDQRDERGHYLGKKGSPSEHCTVGTYRAWCHACGEWCYPDSPCEGADCCRAPEAAAAQQVATKWRERLAGDETHFLVERDDLSALVRWSTR